MSIRVPQGYSLAGVHCRIKRDPQKQDFTLVMSEGPATAVGVYTQNLVCGAPVELRASPDMIRKGLAVYGSWHYNLSLYPKIMQVIRESPVIDAAQGTSPLISHTMPMSQVQQALELCATHRCSKIILDPWG